MEVTKRVVNNVMGYIITIDEYETFIYEGKWNKSNIINDLIRLKYSQDHVEAIINNHFLNIAEWLDAKFKGEEVKFSDPEYDEFQAWRKECKVIADDALAIYPEY